MRSTFTVQRLPGAVVTQESKTKQHKLWDHRPSGANLHAAKIQDDLDRKIKELRDAAFQEQTTLLLNAPNACIVASGLRWERHPVGGWSHGPREQEQPDADSKPSSDLGPCSASPLATKPFTLGDTADRTIAIAEPAGDAEGITRICTTCGALVREHHERAYQTKPSYKLNRLGVHRAVQEIEHFAVCNDEMNDVMKKLDTTMLPAIARGAHERRWD